MVLINPQVPTVSFTFDDFPASALHTGGEVLRENNCHGTYYVSLGLAGKTIETGTMYTESDLIQLVAEGHELGCHTFHHCPSWETSTSDFVTSVRKNQLELLRILPEAHLNTLSYPISTPRPRTKRAMQRLFTACRGGGNVVNNGTCDRNYLSSCFIEQYDTTAELECLIAALVRENGWLIFSTHDVSLDPTPYGCRPDTLRRLVKLCLDSGVQILPLGAAYRKFTEMN